VIKVIFQCMVILFPTLVSIFYPLQKIVYGILSIVGIDTNNLDIAIKSITDNEKIISIICGLILSVFINFWIRKTNTERLFNTGNSYNKYPFYIYWISHYILGYGTVSLIRVPIYLQYKIILSDIFPDIIVDSEVENKEQPVTIVEKNMEKTIDELNLILVDTYEIKKDQIPLDKLKLPTVIIQNGYDFSGHRFFNPEFVKKIREKTNLYSKTFKQVNIFSTTNTNHNKEIVSKCFKNGNRTGFKNIIVYQANREDYTFSEKHQVH